MRKSIAIAMSCAVVAAFGAGSAVANPGHGNGQGGSSGKPNAHALANRLCVTEKHSIGNAAFKAKYGKHAMRTCRRAHLPQAKAQIRNAAQACKSEAADPNFATAHAGLTFAQFYGTNANHKNAFGKCVSGKVKTAQS